jgi:hypothetical protein
MNNPTVKLQIPLDKSLRDKVAKHARAMGFSSLQDFTRVMYSTVVHDNLQFSLSSEKKERLSPAAEARYTKQLEDYEADLKTGKVKSFDNVEDFLADLKK